MEEMAVYIGTKLIKAVPMTRGEYNSYRGWTVPAGENPQDTGCLVEYVDGGKSNDPRHAGYISWSPRDVFEKAYRKMGLLTFGLAIEAMRKGLKVCRAGWNGRGMYVVLQKAYPDGIPINKNTAEATGLPEGTLCRFLPYIMMKTVDSSFVPWLASQTDILAEDWTVVTNG
jgi:hypothetical protein